MRVTGRWGGGAADSEAGGGDNDDERGAATGSAPSRGRIGAPEASVRVTAPGVRGDCGVGAESGGEPDDGCTGATTIGAPEASVRVTGLDGLDGSDGLSGDAGEARQLHRLAGSQHLQDR